MTEEHEALRAMAAHRGCRLVRSRRRKPGGDFGLYGLKDAQSGEEVFGFSKKGLTATAEEIREHLRGGLAAEWKSSLASAPKPARSAAANRKSAPTGAPRRKRVRPEPAPPPPPPPTSTSTSTSPSPFPSPPKQRADPQPAPEPGLREAAPRDAEAIAALLTENGRKLEPAELRRRLKAGAAGGTFLVAAAGKEVAGFVAAFRLPSLWFDGLRGRIELVVVAEPRRGAGLGRRLIAAASARLAEQGCVEVEMATSPKAMRFQNFLQSIGFARSYYGFTRKVDE